VRWCASIQDDHTASLASMLVSAPLAAKPAAVRCASRLVMKAMEPAVDAGNGTAPATSSSTITANRRTLTDLLRAASASPAGFMPSPWLRSKPRDRDPSLAHRAGIRLVVLRRAVVGERDVGDLQIGDRLQTVA